MTTALDDILALDLTNQFSSSLSAAFLADFGARVIRIEHTGSKAAADPSREAVWNYRDDLVHRNKQSLALDLDSEAGRKLLRELAAKVDVVVTDWQRTDLEQLALDYTALAGDNPGLVYARISGFGPQGPDADLPAIDELAAARSGVMPTLPQPGQPPVYTGAGAMHATALLAYGVIIALIHRQATGAGQEVDTSLFAANMYGASLDLQAFLAIGDDDPQHERMLKPISRLDVSNPMSGSIYPSADGRWVTLTMPDTDRWWPLLAPAVGIDEHDERFNTHDKRCEINRLALIEELEQGFQQQPGAHWRQVFAEKHMSADVIERFDYPVQDPQVAANRYILDLDHPSFGPIKTLGFPIFMSDTPARMNSLAPCAGQHTAGVLHDLLGYSEDDIYQFFTQGVIA